MQASESGTGTMTQFTMAGLDALLRKLPADSSDEVIRDNYALVERLGQPACFLSLAQEVLDDLELRAAIAGRSYRHVNHFDKIVLIDTGAESGYRLTLHFWNPPYTEEEVNDELIHDHRFSFWSHVLTGNLVSDNYVEADDGEVFKSFRYSPEKKQLSSVANFYEFVGETKLRKEPQSHKSAGECYYLFNERIHQVLLPHDSIACTLVLRGPRRRGYAKVFNTTYPTQDQRMTNTMFTESELASKLTVLSDEIRRTRSNR